VNERPGAPALSIRNVSKSYGETLVLRDVSFDVWPGEAIALAGENGAGKSTLLDIICGVKKPDAGRMYANGAAYEPNTHHEANRRGFFRVFQESSLVPTLSVYENLLLSHENFFERFGVLDRGAMRRTARGILAQAGLSLDDARPAGELSLAQRQALEIARATALGSLLGVAQTTILLDEPTTALDATEQRAVLTHLNELKRSGRAIVFVSHRYTEIAALCERVCVLKDGSVVQELRTAQLTPDVLRSLMVGRDAIGTMQRVPAAAQAERVPMLEVSELSTDGVSDISCRIGAGEILGVCGLEGSGKTNLGRVLAGALKRSAGAVLVNGRSIAPTVRAALRAGVVYLPGDRQVDGLILLASVEANIALPSLLDLFSNALGVVRERRRRAHVKDWLARLDIGHVAPLRACDTLSGGQQQRVLFAKCAGRTPRVLILENPTRGVDIETKLHITAFLQTLAGNGAAIVLISDDLPELITLADRIVVLAAGRLVASIDTGERTPTERELLDCMMHMSGSEDRPALDVTA
jgi:ABC-type sugar transport system ATPase subunit